MSVTSTEEAVPSLKALASSDARLRRLALQEIFANLSERSAPLTHAQCLQLWRGFFVALYMHDSKSMVSVQNLTASLADQFTVIAGKHAESVTDGGVSQLGVFSEAFWETMAREWSGIDVHRMNKILLLIRMATRNLFKICVPQFESGAIGKKEINEQCSVFEKWPLSPRERKVPDGLRYHVLDIWVDELGHARSQANEDQDNEMKITMKIMMEPVERLAKDGLTKPVRTRAKETLVTAKQTFGLGIDET